VAEAGELEQVMVALVSADGDLDLDGRGAAMANSTPGESTTSPTNCST
jgi:hypothetical protein